MDKEKIRKGVELLLEGLNEDPNRSGLIKTPQRFADMCEEVFFSYQKSVPEISTFTEENSGQPISLRGISFVSFCEHHLVPFYGQIAITYKPLNNKVVGFGSISKVCAYFAAKLQIQERMTHEIGDFLFKTLNPESLEVEVEAKHFCMRLHGEKKESVVVKTNYLNRISEDL